MAIQNDALYNGLTKAARINITKNYETAFKNVKSQLADLFEKHEKEGVLTYAELARFNQLQGIQNSIYAEIKNLTDVNKKRVYETSVSAYVEGHFNEAWRVEQKLKVNMQFGLLNPNTIIASVLNPIDKMTLIQRMEPMRADITTKIKDGITQGLMQGESYGEMTKRVKGALENDLVKTIRVVNTEAHRNMANGRLESLKQSVALGVDMKKVWVSTLDRRTRDTHKAIDGQKAEVNGLFKMAGMTADAPGNFMVAKEDINCRCTIRGEIKDFEPEERMAREIDDEPGAIVKQQTYRKWMNGKFDRKHINGIDRLIKRTTGKIAKIATPTPSPTMPAPGVTPPPAAPKTSDEFKKEIRNTPAGEQYDKIMAQVDQDIKENLGLDEEMMDAPTDLDDYWDDAAVVERNIGNGRLDRIKLLKPYKYANEFQCTEITEDMFPYVEKFKKAKTRTEQIKVIRKIELDMGPQIDEFETSNTPKIKRMSHRRLANALTEIVVKDKKNIINITELWAKDTTKTPLEKIFASHKARDAGEIVRRRTGDLTTKIPTGGTKKRMAEATQWMQDYVDKDFIPGQGAPITTNVLKNGTRAWAQTYQGIFVANDTNTDTIIHESGHIMHGQSVKSQKLVNDFWEKRTKGETQQVMYKLRTGPEYGIKDQFKDHYAGRVYGWEGYAKGQEVVSMGMQQMYADPTKFYIEDPEHFKLIYALMKGWN